MNSVPLLIWFLNLCFLLKCLVPPSTKVSLILQDQPQPPAFPKPSNLDLDD